MVRKIIMVLASITFTGAVAASTAADARMGGGGGFHGGGFGGGFHGAAMAGGFRGAAMGGGFRGAAMGGGFRSAAIGGGFRGGFVRPRSFAFRPGFAPRFNRFAFARFHRFNRFAFARFHRFHHRRFFTFAAVPFVVGVGDSCWRWRPTPWGWRRVWVCG
jgi:hypothetical protein